MSQTEQNPIVNNDGSQPSQEETPSVKKYEQAEVDKIVDKAKQRLAEKHSKELENFISKSDYETLNKEYKTFKIKQDFVNTFGGKEEAFDLFLEKNSNLLNEENPKETIRTIKDNFSYMFKMDTNNIDTSKAIESVKYYEGTNIKKY